MVSAPSGKPSPGMQGKGAANKGDFSHIGGKPKGGQRTAGSAPAGPARKVEIKGVSTGIAKGGRLR